MPKEGHLHMPCSPYVPEIRGGQILSLSVFLRDSRLSRSWTGIRKSLGIVRERTGKEGCRLLIEGVYGATGCAILKEKTKSAHEDEI